MNATAYPNLTGSRPSGSAPFSPFTYVYQQPMTDTSNLYFPEGRVGDYRGLGFRKEDEHQLYYLEAPLGKQLPSQLAARFTKISLLHEAIDKYFSEHPELPDYLEPKPKRDHHKKKPNVEDKEVIINETN